ncbi:Protein of unknown function (DUF3050) [Thioflavicoccus mobilis 8321]|uniref:Heme oxygenase-like protein n=1 Tax=Thioflavicoccus mobilis 8321 TaxID=765912 RepID=L0GWT6_9GAMM|nr:DUF3050 domain-containing protein [Thioflavicoccus mobilis]AGA90292.1 Protein of unknown function (DUF3050) [Thioflavicoccus mobilis 8321]
MPELDLEPIRELQAELDQHPLYTALRDITDLRLFMAHHVYPVWDFISLIKYLQDEVAPTRVPWLPGGDPAVRHFINQLVLEEESDAIPDAGGEIQYASHFEGYLAAMEEIDADAERPRRFLTQVAEQGVDAALYSDLVPLPARCFCETTFGFIRAGKPHMAAAALAFGREQAIPSMFRRLLAAAAIDAKRAPRFHQYLERHIHLDEDFHGPLSLRLLAALCDADAERIGEAEAAAEEAICARLRLWDGVLEAIEAAR